MRITDDNLHGRVVLTSDGLAIGEVSKLYLQGAQFAIDGIEVKLRKEIAERLGMERSVFHPAMLEIAAPMVQSVGDAVLLGVTLDALRALRTTANTPHDSSLEPMPDRPPART
jgi:hypothetical protein